MRASAFGTVLGFATVFATCIPAASTAPLANTATWITPLPGVNWHPAESYVANSLSIESESGVATVMFNDIGQGWRFRVNSQGEILTRERSNRGFGHRSLSNRNPLIFTSSYQSWEQPTYTRCTLNAHGANLVYGWSHTFTGSTCQNTLIQRDGGVASASTTTVFSHNGQGQIRWQRNWSEIGFPAAVLVQQAIETSTGRLLVLASNGNNAPPRKVIWVLDSSTGQSLAVHERPNGGYDALASRERSDQVIEILEVQHQNGQMLAEVSRWSAQGEFIDSNPLSSFSRLHSAMAHPAGFILYGKTATDTGIVRYYNGLELRWQAPLPAGQDYLRSVEHEGSLLVSTYSQLLRFDSNGQALEPLDIGSAEPIYAEDGSLWILEPRALRHYPSANSFELYRYAPGAITASFRLPLQLPIRFMNIASMQLDPADDLQVASSLYADSAHATEHRLQIQKVNSTGQFSMTVDREWPDYQIDAIHAVNSGWIVESTARYYPNPELAIRAWLRRLDAAGQIMWERQLPGNTSRPTICNGDDQCAVVFFDSEHVFQRFHIDGPVLSELRGPDANINLHLDEAGRMFGVRRDADTVSLLDLSVTPPQALATVPHHNYGQYRPLRGRLLVQTPDGVSTHAGGQVIWSRSDISESTQLSTRQGRLHLGQKPTEGPLRVLQLDPDTGSTLSSIDLPPEFVSFERGPENSANATVLIDGATDGEQWVLANTATELRLLALTPGAPVRQFSHPNRISEIRAVPGAVYAMTAVAYTDNSETYMRRAVSRFTLDLFSNGFEAP